VDGGVEQVDDPQINDECRCDLHRYCTHAGVQEVFLRISVARVVSDRLRTVDRHYSITRPDDDSAAIRFPVAG
jgi:hypothetical protein